MAESISSWKLVKAIQEQQAQIEELKQDNENLTNSLALLSQRIEELKTPIIPPLPSSPKTHNPPFPIFSINPAKPTSSDDTALKPRHPAKLKSYHPAKLKIQRL